MAHIVPSQARAVIERLFGWVLSPATAPPTLARVNASDVAGVLAVVAEIPSELLAVDGELLAVFFEARARAGNFIKQVNMMGQWIAGPFSSATARCPPQIRARDRSTTTSAASMSYPVPQSTNGSIEAGDLILANDKVNRS